jgi:PAS domain S-box-containing protein
MNFIQISLGILIGSFLISSILSLLLALKKYETKLNLSYFLFSFLLILNTTFSILHYCSADLQKWILLEKIQNSCVELLGITFVLFIGYFTGNTKKYILIINAIIIALFLFINWLSPYGIAYSFISSIKYNIETQEYLATNWIASWWNILIYGYFVFLSLYVIDSTRVLYKKGEKNGAILLIISTIVGAISIISDIMLMQCNIKIPFLENIGFIMFVVVVTSKNFDSVIKSNKIKDELIETEKKYESLIESSPDSILVHAEGNILFANKNCLQMMGFDNFEETKNVKFLDLILQEYHEFLKERKKLMVKTNSSLPPAEIKMVKYNNEISEIEIISYPVNYGGVNAIHTLMRDITGRKRAETELKILTKAVEQSSAAIMITDPNWKIEYVNPKFEEMTGYKIDEIIGKTTKLLKGGKLSAAIHEEFSQTLFAGKEWRGQLLNKKKNGELYWERNSISPIKNSKGETTNFVSIKEDITDEMRIKEELIKSKDEAEQANKLKSTLLSNVSHEFRTPLNGILGFAQILKEIVFDKTYFDMADKISKSGLRLLNTLNSVLLLTELENKTYIVTKKETNISDLCRRIKSKYDDVVKNKNLEFNVNLSEENIEIKTDETVLVRILSSIVENAIKYTKNGNISIILENGFDETGSERIFIKVSDTGIGIKNENIDIIFEEFKQISEGYSREYEGLGLGLTIAKKLATLINSEILVSSQLGKGSTFTVVLPLERDSAYKQVHGILWKALFDNSKGNNIKEELDELPEVLLVEDNVINVEVVEHYLKGLCRLSSALDGEAAIKMISEKSFKLLLLDINLGNGFDGIEVLKEIKKREEYKDVPAIALTGYASDRNKKEFLENGFSGFLAKPFNKNELISIVNSVFETV